MRCPAPHASLICPCFGKPEVLGNVGNDGPGSEAARERSRASPTSSNGSLSHSEWFADEIARKFSISHCASLSGIGSTELISASGICDLLSLPLPRGWS